MVTIITRTKNRSLLLRRCIETILAQTYEEWQHVIVNDGGDKEEVDFLVGAYGEQYDGRLKVIHNERSVGMEAASNIGIRASDSKYICILDDDDTWHKDFLLECVNYLKNKEWSDIRGVVCHTHIVYEEIRGECVIRKKEVPFNTWIKVLDIISLLSWNRFTPVSFLFERSALQEVGYFDESLPVCGDWDFNIRFLLKYEIAVLPKVLAFWHQRPALRSVYGNSVHAGRDLHAVYRTRITNRWIRESVGRGSVGLGELFVLSLLIEFKMKIVSLKNRIRKLVTFGLR